MYSVFIFKYTPWQWCNMYTHWKCFLNRPCEEIATTSQLSINSDEFIGASQSGKSVYTNSDEFIGAIQSEKSVNTNSDELIGAIQSEKFVISSLIEIENVE